MASARQEFGHVVHEARRVTPTAHYEGDNRPSLEVLAHLRSAPAELRRAQEVLKRAKWGARSKLVVERHDSAQGGFWSVGAAHPDGRWTVWFHPTNPSRAKDRDKGSYKVSYAQVELGAKDHGGRNDVHPDGKTAINTWGSNHRLHHEGIDLATLALNVLQHVA